MGSAHARAQGWQEWDPLSREHQRHAVHRPGGEEDQQPEHLKQMVQKLVIGGLGPVKDSIEMQKC